MAPEHQPEHPSVAHFRRELERLGGTGEIRVLPEGVHTAGLAAAALGCEVGAIANSLLFDAGDQQRQHGQHGPEGRPVLVLTSGAHRVDVAMVATAIGVETLRRASPDFVRRHTGQVIGGVSPLAHPDPVPTYLDAALAQHLVIWAAAGHPAAVFSTTFDELARLTGATVLDVA